MSGEISWPPTSPKAALLSSPSGRKRYSEAMERSPIKRSRTTPNLLSRLQDARNETHDENDPMNDDDDDEETLKLQLAAIEAKLKLKKLQQAKARPESRSMSDASGSQRAETVQVALSPVKRAIPQKDARSPSRVLLGIDKGKTGADMSLKRAKSVSEKSTTSTSFSRPEISLSRAPQLTSRLQNAGPAPKSFSERMAEVRDKDKGKQDKRQAAQENRTASFSLDKSEMEGYRALAEENRKAMPPPTRPSIVETFTREDVLRGKSASARLQKSSSTPDQNGTRASSRGPPSSPSQPDSALYESFSGINLSSRILPHTFLKRTLPSEQFSIYTIADLLRDVKSPEYEMPDTVTDYVVFGIIASKSNTLDHAASKAAENSTDSKGWESKWDDGSQNSKKFIVMTLTDLNWTVDLYLFGTAVPRYHRLTPGTVIAILNPGIMPPKKGHEDTGAFGLTLHGSDDTVLEIGTARELGHCSAKRKDGKECGAWVNIAKTEVCEFHLNLQLYKTEQGRSGINAGSHGYGASSGKNKRDKTPFAPYQKSDMQSRREFSTFDNRRKGIREGEAPRFAQAGLLPRKNGQRFDGLGQAYYVAQASAPTPPPSHAAMIGGINTARAMDLDVDDPMGKAEHIRDRKQLLARRKERQAQELEIASRLGNGMAGVTSGGAGAEYMRARSNASKPNGASASAGGSRLTAGGRITAQSIKGSILRPKTTTTDGGSAGASSGARKRAGSDMRLSPMKKTRFVTEKGIREAGRESLGVVGGGGVDEDEDEDDLDIV